jgi:hypothetical protein
VVGQHASDVFVGLVQQSPHLVDIEVAEPTGWFPFPAVVSRQEFNHDFGFAAFREVLADPSFEPSL